MLYQKLNYLSIVFLVILISGCTPLPSTSTVKPPEMDVQTSTLPEVQPTQSPSPDPTITIDPTSNFQIRSPLQDISLPELLSIESTPYDPPESGLDSGHHGIDFAYYSRGEHTMMEGLEIYSILNGVVAGISNGKNPYGNMIIIETPLDTIPQDLIAQLQVPEELIPNPENPRLICPIKKPDQWLNQPQSIYLLYGHMQRPTELTIGSSVNAGELIGFVGSTGASGNPHLHLEMRFGPGGTKFASMGHYNTAITADEMSEYCLWRISGQYQLADPMSLLQIPSPIR